MSDTWGRSRGGSVEPPPTPPNSLGALLLSLLLSKEDFELSFWLFAHFTTESIHSLDIIFFLDFFQLVGTKLRRFQSNLTT